MQILIDIKTSGLLIALSNQGIPVYTNLNNLELFDEEPISELMRISSELKLIDNDLAFLKDTKVTNNQIIISEQSFDYESSSDLLTGKSLFQRIVNAKLRENKSKKRIALFYDSKEANYGLVILNKNYLIEIIQALENLEEVGEDTPENIADYISNVDSREFEIISFLNDESIHFFARLGENKW